MNGLISEELLVNLARWLGVGIFVKATIILSSGAAVVWIQRRTSAASRYAIWCVALALLLVLPLADMTMPSWHLFTKSETLTLGSAAEGVASDASSGEVDSGTASEIAPPKETPASSLSAPAEIAKGTDPISLLASAFLSLWLIGVGVMAVRLLRDIAYARAIVSAATIRPSDEISELAESLRAELEVERSVAIHLGDQINIPFSWGWFRPVVVLPSAARQWPQDQLRSVLAHELAHIARWDHLLLLLGELARALYWVNPLAWWAVHQAARERECSCDDIVLNRGVASDRYATHLIAVARLQLAQVPAIGMAGSGGLAERIDRVMNKTMDRSHITGLGLIGLFVFACMAMMPVATAQLWGTEKGVPKTGALIDVLEDDTDPMERRLAAWWLGEHESSRAVRPLIRALNDESAEVRQVAAWSLGEIKSDRAIDPLILALEDEDAYVREMAALALGEIEDSDAIEALERAAARDADLREPVIWALGEIGGRKANDVRSAICEDLGRRDHDNQQVWAGDLEIRYTSRGREPERGVDISYDVAGLVGDLGERDAATRHHAAYNIGVLGCKDELDSTDAVEPLLDLLRDPDPEVRAMATWSLDEINPSRWHHRGDRHHTNRHHPDRHH